MVILSYSTVWIQIIIQVFLQEVVPKSFVLFSFFYQGMIRDAIEDSITWPVRKIIPILPGDYRCKFHIYLSILLVQLNLLALRQKCLLFFRSDLELKPVGTLDVKLVQAKDLTNKDLIGKSDPFAVLYIRPLPDKMKKSRVIVRPHLKLLII